MATKKLSKQQILLTEYKDILLKMKEEKQTIDNILLHLNKKLKIEIEIKRSHLQTFFKNNSKGTTYPGIIKTTMKDGTTAVWNVPYKLDNY